MSSSTPFDSTLPNFIPISGSRRDGRGAANGAETGAASGADSGAESGADSGADSGAESGAASSSASGAGSSAASSSGSRSGSNSGTRSDSSSGSDTVSSTDSGVDTAGSTPGNGDRAAAAPPSARTRVRRIPEFARYGRAAVHAIVDQAFLCHIAFSAADGIHCIPTACWRQDNHLYIHGSNGSRMIKALQTGAQATVNITLLDGLVLARSAFNHAMNYRSVVIYGHFETVPEPDKPLAVARFLEHILPGRQAMIRPGDAKELAATTVLRIALDEAAAKVRTGVPEDNPEDMDWPVWAGVLPLTLVPGVPARDPLCSEPAPAHVLEWPQRRFHSP